MQGIKSYDAHRAAQYDEESNFDKGNNEQHCDVLRYTLSYLKRPPGNFLELGCGTGYYTNIFLNEYPQMQCVLVDGSIPMLDIAKEKLSNKRNIHFRHMLLEDIDWDSMPEMDIVYSGLTIHHLAHVEKYKLYTNIYYQLSSGGMFIYLDQFKTDDGEINKLNEYLACKDIQRRLMNKLSLTEEELFDEIRIENIIKNDRAIKAAEGDNEDLIENTVNKLNEIGFKLVTIVYQEFRIFCIVAFK